jgi:hypothetical protein
MEPENLVQNRSGYTIPKTKKIQRKDKVSSIWKIIHIFGHKLSLGILVREFKAIGKKNLK